MTSVCEGRARAKVVSGGMRLGRGSAEWIVTLSAGRRRAGTLLSLFLAVPTKGSGCISGVAFDLKFKERYKV